MPLDEDCLFCPLCKHIPLLIIGTRQAFCGNDDCLVFTWDMSASLEQNLMDARPVKITSSSPSDPPVDEDGRGDQHSAESP